MLREYYRRNLPHIIPLGATFFVTFRLHGSIPKSILEALKKKREENLEKLFLNKELSENERQAELFALEKHHFAQFNHTLDTIKEGPHQLRIPELAQIVVDRMEAFNGKYYKLCSYVIMSNHVHALLDFSIQIGENKFQLNEDNYKQLESVLGLIKGGSAKYCNDWLKEHQLKPLSPFWEAESYDRFIRNEQHYENTVNYILNNPVKVGICKDWREYPFAMRI